MKNQSKKIRKAKKNPNAKSGRHTARILAIAAFFVFVSLIFIARLINIQIAGRDFYVFVDSTTYERTVKIQAQRGEIFDRNGTPLVVNKYTYNIALDSGTLPMKNNAKLNAALLNIYSAIKSSDATYKLREIAFPGKGMFPNYTVNEEFFKSSANSARLSRLLSNLGIEDIGTIIKGETYPYALSYFEKFLAPNDVMRSLYNLKIALEAGSSSVTLDDVVKKLAIRYGIINKNGELLNDYDNETADFLLRLRYDMEANDFSGLNPYTIATDADIKLITYLEEGSLRGFTVTTTANRVYLVPGVASHILGRTGKIPSDKVEYYTEQGYPLDAIVGRDGVEAAFESYLHGVDGTMVIVEDEYGNIVDQYIKKEPIAGCDVYLTIDIGLQAAAEKALKDNIEYIHKQAELTEGDLDGEDAKAGALTVIDVKTGAVLALASYPSFNLATYSEDFEKLSADEAAPLFNRALQGTYPPGSTFKPAVAAAALSEGIINEKTIINTKGEYEYYKDSGFTPRCWLYISTGKSHGPINVSEAIKVSCNYFFYEIGRLLTIQRMNKYCRAFGLGEKTGIELPESTGVLAGPDYREESGLDPWNPGDTLAAAIGQSDNLFSPLQISVYMSALINCGERRSAHILGSVRKYGTNEIVYEAEPKVLSSIQVSEKNVKVILNAMQTVIETGTVATLFDNYPIKVGGKTGTAQVSKNKSDNAVFVGFAPFDDPEIVATCVIEQGAKGAWAGVAVRDVFTHYFGFDFFSGGDENSNEGENNNNNENTNGTTNNAAG